MSDHRKACGTSEALVSREGSCNALLLNALTMLIMQETLLPSIFCYHSSAYWEL